MIYRTDRYSRGGDQAPMLAAGYPAIRFTEATENYNREHQDVRVVGGIDYGDTLAGIDFPYLANLVRLNAITMAALAMAPAPPPGVKIEGAVSYDTTVSWTPAAGAADYCVWWRDTTAPMWTNSQLAPPGATSLVLKNNQHRRLVLRRLVHLGGRLRKPGGVSRAGRRVRKPRTTGASSPLRDPYPERRDGWQVTGRVERSPR
ncbi:MAG TPA: hypothetical protein VHX61_18525 [Rhizomicrobium sp.]|jgi:hypothetical protein|nr:hypothetical protein [Rhizomicrobium sp.]